MADIILTPEEKKLADDSVIVLNGALAQVSDGNFQAFKTEVINQLNALQAGSPPTPQQLVGASLNLIDDVAQISKNAKFIDIMNILDSGWQAISGGTFNIFTAIGDFIKLKSAAKA